MTAVDALRLIGQQQFDVAFIDIHLPGLSGLELAKLLNGLERAPALVIVTAYEEYALQAFSIRAVDYLLKPVSTERLRDTVERVRAARRIEPPKLAAAEPARLDRLPIESQGRTMLVDLRDIRYAEAKDDIVYVKLHDQQYPTRFSLNELERRLPSPPFLRIHRSFIANMRNVIEISPYFNGAYLLKVNDRQATELTVSRGRVKGLLSLLGI
jgi:DNA-binding LytR/AlgR family response regulator